MNIGEFIGIVQPLSMTTHDRIAALFHALEEVRAKSIPGDFVECGVWRGGNVVGMAAYAKSHEMSGRRVWAYDTFDGMVGATEFDKSVVGEHGEAIRRGDPLNCEASLEGFMLAIRLLEDVVTVVPGDVCETLSTGQLPTDISILRLDTDFYSSTRKELEVLFPRLSAGGFCIIDDYGHWNGCRRAVDEYFHGAPVLAMADYSCAIIRKVA